MTPTTRSKKSRPGLGSEPQVRYLQQVLEDLRRSELEIPRFQRPFVWKDEQRIELLRSVRDGIPMGSILVWRTSRADIGTYRIPSDNDRVSAPNEGIHHYILDGVQRLSTLLGALYPNDAARTEQRIEDEEGPQDSAELEGDDLSAAFDLEAGDFVLGSPAQEVHHLPLALLYDSVGLIKFQRGLMGPRSEHWIAQADALARAFREYKVPIIPIVTEDLAMATRTFQRVNSQGTKMGELHMLHALAWSEDRSLLQSFADGKEEHLAPLGWGDLDDDVIVKACKAALDFKIYEQKKVDEVSQKIADNPAVVDSVFVCLSRATQFLNEDCGIRGPAMLPYAMQAVVLAEAFRANPKPDRASVKRLWAWFWASTYGELFSAISGSRLEEVVVATRTIAKGRKASWPWSQAFSPRPLPRVAHLRGARAKALAARLADIEPRNSAGQPLKKPHILLAKYGAQVFVTLIPRKFVSSAEYGSPQNRIIGRVEDVPKLRARILGGGPTNTKLLRSHAISAKAEDALGRQKYSDFLALRREEIDSIESSFVEGVRACL
jgi:hypothetical protein